MNWEYLINEQPLASVLPANFAYLARPIRDSLVVFLEGLTAEQQAAIFAQQAQLAPDATVSARLAALARSCPVLQKLGQILARDQRLASDLRLHLRELESLPPTVPLETIQEILAREIGPLDRLGITLLPPAIAEASVAVVIPFEHVAKGSQKPRKGVFKILKPNIEERLALELALLERVGHDLDQRCEELQIPQLDYGETFQQIQQKLRYEIRLDQEQRHLVRAAEFYADEPGVQIPALFDACTPRVTAMEFVCGEKVTDHRLTCPQAKRQLSKLLIKSLIAKPIFAKGSHSLFHSDPHAGNLFFTEDQRLAILDWSLVGSLKDRERIAMGQITLNAMMLRGDRIVAQLEELDERGRVDRPALEKVVQEWLQRVRHGRLPGFSWLTGMLDEAVHTARLGVAADLMLFRKSLHTLEGVVTEVGAEGSYLDEVLFVEFLVHFLQEWPQRWLALPYCRQFATRLSNFDLTKALLSGPGTIARYWLAEGLDLWNARRTTYARE